MLYRKQTQHWRYYQSGKLAAVNPGHIHYRAAYQKPLTAYCVFGKHKLILRQYKIEKKGRNKLAIGVCPVHKVKVAAVMGK